MCDVCMSGRHLPGCPNAPDPVPVLICHECGEWIFIEDQYLDTIDGPICMGCLSEKTVEEMLKIFGERLSVA